MNKARSPWHRLEIAWLTFFSITTLVVTVTTEGSLLGFTVSLTGIICAILAAKGIVWSHAFGLYNTVAYAFVAYQNQLFGEMGLNLLFFVPMSFVGFFQWRSKRNADGVVLMRKLDTRNILIILCLCVVGIGIARYGLMQVPGQRTPFINAITTVLSVAATILMILRYREQWLLFILLNSVTVLMWALRLGDGSSEATMMIVMWTAYLTNAIYGYIVWSKGAKSNCAAPAAAPTE